MPNFNPLKISLAALTIVGIIYSSTDLVSARGGHGGGRYSSHGGSVHVRGYTRKDGTYVSPYTRSAPGYGSRSSYSESPSSPTYSAPTSPIPSESSHTENPQTEETMPDAERSDTSTIETDTGTSATETIEVPTVTEPISPFSSKATSNPLPDKHFDDTNSSEATAQPKGLPNNSKESCGDSSSDDKATWYPVFINNGNVQEIRKKLCADAVLTTRTDTNTPAVQVASFTTRKSALEFAKAVAGEVGQPSTSVELKKAVDQNSAAVQNQSRDDRDSFLKTASPVTSAPPSVNTSTASQESGSGMMALGAIGLIGFGLWRRFKHA